MKPMLEIRLTGPLERVRELGESISRRFTPAFDGLRQDMLLVYLEQRQCYT